MPSQRPLSLSIYSVFIWLTKLALFCGNLYFIKYVLDHQDFYIGIGLHTTLPQQFILVGGGIIVFAGTIGIFRMKKSGWKLYLIGKGIEAIAIFWAYPSWSGAFTHAFYGINSTAFSLTFLGLLICAFSIFPLIYYTWSRQFR